LTDLKGLLLSLENLWQTDLTGSQIWVSDWHLSGFPLSHTLRERCRPLLTTSIFWQSWLWVRSRFLLIWRKVRREPTRTQHHLHGVFKAVFLAWPRHVVWWVPWSFRFSRL